MKNKKISCLFLILILMFISSTVVYSSENSVGYSVSTIIPPNQINKKATYFDLMMDKNKKQTIEIVIYNSSSEILSFNVKLTNGQSNVNGIVDYSSDDITKTDESLQFPFSSIASLENNIVKVMPHSSLNVPITIEMPKEKFDGVILGGIYITKELSDDDSSSGLSIRNRYGYVIGVMLRENNKILEPNINLISVHPTLNNYRNNLAIKIQNDQPIFMKNVSIKAEVFKEFSSNVFKSSSNSDFTLAPNCNVNYLVDWENEEFVAGSYRLKMTAKTNDNVWEWNETFIIEKDEAKENNENAVELISSHKTYNFLENIVLSLVAALLLSITILFRVIYIHKMKEEKGRKV